MNVEDESGHHGENNNLVPRNEVPPTDPSGVPVANPIDVNSQVAIAVNLPTDPKNIIRGGPRPTVLETPECEGDRVSLRLIFEMLQAQHAAIA